MKNVLIADVLCHIHKTIKDARNRVLFFIHFCRLEKADIKTSVAQVNHAEKHIKNAESRGN